MLVLGVGGADDNDFGVGRVLQIESDLVEAGLGFVAHAGGALLVVGERDAAEGLGVGNGRRRRRDDRDTGRGGGGMVFVVTDFAGDVDRAGGRTG